MLIHVYVSHLFCLNYPLKTSNTLKFWFPRHPWRKILISKDLIGNMSRDVKGFVQMEPLRQIFARRLWLPRVRANSFFQVYRNAVQSCPSCLFWPSKAEIVSDGLIPRPLSSSVEPPMTCFIQLKVMSYCFCTCVFSRGVCQSPR